MAARAVLPYIRYLSSFATVAVPDLDEAVKWYATAFGFEVVARDPDSGVHIRRSEGQDLLLIAGQASGAAALRLHLAVDGELTRFIENAMARGARRVERSSTADVTLRDPYGHEWSFFARSVPAAVAAG